VTRPVAEDRRNCPNSGQPQGTSSFPVKAIWPLTIREGQTFTQSLWSVRRLDEAQKFGPLFSGKFESKLWTGRVQKNGTSSGC
jgi:hypothetical protein